MYSNYDGGTRFKMSDIINNFLNIHCPVCGKNAIHIAVCDDEGNIHGFVGCEYENDPWSGLGYVLIHDGWGECILSTDGDQGCLGGIVFDTPNEALKALKISSCKDDTNLY